MSVLVAGLFFVIALLYSAAGFGGGSSYLAILALANIDYTLLRPIALTCNLAVVSFATVVHLRAGNLQIRRIWPLMVLSIPAAFVGGTLVLVERSYFLLLGGALIAVGIAMALRHLSLSTTPSGTADAEPVSTGRTVAGLGIGAGVGLLSGLVGIGGGVFLAPILHLTGWGTPRQIAATTTVFIAVNSAAGLAGQIAGGLSLSGTGLGFLPVAALVVAVIAGGQIGSRLTARHFGPRVIRWLTAALVVFVGVKILVQYL